MQEYNYEKLLLCLDQKVLIMRDIRNITKRIEVEAQSEDIQLDSLLTDRQNRIERIIKCDKLISDELSEVEGEFKSHLRDLLAGKPEAASNDDERKIVELVASVKTHLDRTLEIDKSATEIMLQKREEARLALAEIAREEQSK